MDDFKNIDDIKAEEKRLYEEYKAKVAELKKIQKAKEAVGQVLPKVYFQLCFIYSSFRPFQRQ